MSSSFSTPLSADALLAKSKVFIRRGLLAEAVGSEEEYQLWASLALELLGKAALARVHPALVADPTHYQSIFAACGRVLSPDTKTITAKTVFERLSHLDEAFDKRAQRFCEQMSLRRNAELHSGEAPFVGLRGAAWQVPYWGAVEIILGMCGEVLEGWVGASQAAAPRQLLTDSAIALKHAVADRIARSKESFEAKYAHPKQRTGVIEASKSSQGPPRDLQFYLGAEREEPVECPACTGRAFLGGVEAHEEVVETDSEEPWLEHVETTYSVEEFRCPVCDLHLSGRKELEAAQLDLDFTRCDVRERTFEEEYMNE